MDATIDSLYKDNKKLKKVLHEKEAVIEKLQEELRLYRRQKFQSQSEHYQHPDLFQKELFDAIGEIEPEQEASEINIPSHTRKKRKPKGLSSSLPRVEVVYDLPESERQCACGKLRHSTEEITEQLAIIPAQSYVIRHIRKKYFPCCGKTINTAPMPAQPLPKTQASPQLLAYLMTSKFLDGLPLYRMSKILDRHGCQLSRQNMARWLIQASQWFNGFIKCFEQVLIQHDIVAADETRIQVLKESGRAATTKSWLWIRHGGTEHQPVVLVDYNPSRAAQVPKDLLKDYRAGYLVVDAYAGYNQVAKDNNLTIVGCHDHA